MKRILILLIILSLAAFGLTACDSADDKTPITEASIYTLTMEAPEGEGTVTPGVGTHEFEEDVMVDLEAEPASGWYFSEWQGEVQDSSAAATKIKMDKDQTVKAIFTDEDPALPETGYNLSVKIVDEYSAPVSGVEVSFVGEDIDDFTRVTDGDGYVVLSLFEPEMMRRPAFSAERISRVMTMEFKLMGEVVITPSREDWEFDPASATVTIDDAGKTIEFVGNDLLDPTYQIGGTVEDIHGKGVAEAEVLLSGDDIDEGAIGEILTDADGSWGPIQVEGTVNVTAAKNHWTFTPITVQGADINLVITGEIFKGAVKIPTMTPGAIPLGQSTAVTFNAHVDINPALLTEVDADHATPVSLYRKDGSNSWEFMGNLFDDGNLNHGDEIKGDRIYSNIFNFFEEEAQNIELKLSVNSAENHLIEVKFQLEAASIAEELEGKVLDVHQEAEAELNAILTADPGLTAAESLTQLGGKLLEKEEIVSAVQTNNLLEIGYEFIEPGDNFTAVSFIMIEEDDEDAGLLRGSSSERGRVSTISPSQQTTGKSVSYKYTPLDEEIEYIGSRNIFIWSPFAEEFSPWDETEGVQERFNDSELGFDYSVYENFAADVNSLRSINDYGMAILATHGSGGRWLATGEVVFDDNKYSLDLTGGRMAIWQNMKMVETGGVTGKQPVYAVNDNWFTHHVTGSFDNAIIVNNSCDSLATDGLWNAFASLGAGAYYGYDAIVTSRFAVEQVYELVEGLRDGMTTTGEAFQEKVDPYSGHNARWLMRGEEELVFPAGLINGSFEDGLNAWLKDGDGRAISALSFIEPTDGNVMGIISSGLGFTVRHGSIQQTFRVDDEAEMLRFDYNYLSEEFLEWIGSVYQDPFQVTIESESGIEEILYLTVDGIAADYGASYCASHINPASQCIISGNSGSLIPVSPGIVFDMGDVWMTGWQSFAFDISAYQGEVVTLKFTAEDEGDTAYDTAVLLDNIRIEDSAETKDEYILTINKTGAGETHPSPGSYSYPAGTMAKINAIPDEDVNFNSWHGSAVTDAEAEDTTVLMDGHKTVTAVFVTPVPSTSFIYPVADIDLPLSAAGTEQTLKFEYYVNLGTVNHYFTATLLNYDTLEETTYSEHITDTGFYEGEITYTAPEVDDPAEAVHVVQELEISGQMTPDSNPEINQDTYTVYFTIGFSDDIHEPEGNPEVFHMDITDGWYSHTLPDFKHSDDGYVIHFNRDDAGSIHSFGGLSTELEIDAQSALETVTAAAGKAANLTPELALQYSLRQQELELARRYKEISEIPAKSMVYTAEPEIGDSRYFKVITSISHAGTPTVTDKLATLRAAGSSGLLWVVEDDLNLSEADVQVYMNQYEDNIQPVVTEYFGREPEAHTFGVLEPGARTNILLTDMASGMGGYFWAIDLFSAAEYPNSNEAKVIYISPNAYHTREQVKGTIAHELQHMLFFNEKVLCGRFYIDDLWINEGFSCLASDLVGFGFEQDHGYAYSVDQFLTNIAMTSLLSWEGVHADYGAVYLFTRYIFDREGKEILNAVSTSNDFPQNSIADLAGEDFHRIFADWAVTLLVNDKTGVDSDYTFATISIDSDAISKNTLAAGGSWANKQLKGWGILYTQIPGEGLGGNLEIISDVGSPSGGIYAKTVARYRN